MTNDDLFLSTPATASDTNKDWLKPKVQELSGRLETLRKEMESVAQEHAFMKSLADARSKSWWCHILTIMNREIKLLQKLRQEGNSAIKDLESLFLQAKKEVDEIIYDMPRRIEEFSKKEGLPLDSRCQHPKYLFRNGFITVEIIDSKFLVKSSTYEGKLFEIPADPEAVAEALKREDKRLFGRNYDGKKFLKKIRHAYLSVLKKENKTDGDPVPLRRIMAVLANNTDSFRKDEFVLDLSKLVVEGPAETDGYTFQFLQMRDREQGILLYGAAGTGMVSLIIFKKGGVS